MVVLPIYLSLEKEFKIINSNMIHRKYKKFVDKLDQKKYKHKINIYIYSMNMK